MYPSQVFEQSLFLFKTTTRRGASPPLTPLVPMYGCNYSKRVKKVVVNHFFLPASSSAVQSWPRCSSRQSGSSATGAGGRARRSSQGILKLSKLFELEWLLFVRNQVLRRSPPPSGSFFAAALGSSASTGWGTGRSWAGSRRSRRRGTGDSSQKT